MRGEQGKSELIGMCHIQGTYSEDGTVFILQGENCGFKLCACMIGLA